MYIHFFDLSVLPDARQLHGKPIPSEQFRSLPEEYPDPRFLLWHYSQCVKAHIRGFSVDMNPPI